MQITLHCINGCKTNNDINKKAKTFLTAISYRDIIIVLLLIYTIRSWPYMQILLQTVNYCGKHQNSVYHGLVKLGSQVMLKVMLKTDGFLWRPLRYNQITRARNSDVCSLLMTGANGRPAQCSSASYKLIT